MAYLNIVTLRIVPRYLMTNLVVFEVKPRPLAATTKSDLSVNNYTATIVIYLSFPKATARLELVFSKLTSWFT